MKKVKGVNNILNDDIIKSESTDEVGFTLIELSIVLVIIGLIVGGVLVGQDLIKAAQIRAAIQQIEKYNTSVNTFYGKYGGLPGDLGATAASASGLSYDATNGYGNGNGVIDGSVAGGAWNQEAGWFWVQLSQANLLDGSFSSIFASATPIAETGNASIAAVMPLSRMGNGNYINVGSTGGLNYFLLGGFSATTTSGSITSAGDMTPIQAYSMDAKMDDGSPATGIVQAHGVSISGATASSASTFTDATSGTGTTTSGYCVVGTGSSTTDTYNRNINTGGNTLACIMRFRFN